MEPSTTLHSRPLADGKLLRLALCCAVFLSWIITAAAAAEPNIDTKNFSVDCRPFSGNTERGLTKTPRVTSGFTAVLSDAAHRHYNGPGRAGLQYWIVPGDVAELKSPVRPIARFSSKQQMVQLYGVMRPTAVYTLFVTGKNARGEGVFARSVIKARRCVPYVEPGLIPNELKKTRPLHLG